MSAELKGIWAILGEIKAELTKIDDKWEAHIETAGSDRQKLSTLCAQVDHIERVLTKGNGQKPVLVQLEGLRADLDNLRMNTPEATLEEAKEAQANATRAKWVAVATIAGMLALAIPGFLALMGVGG